VFTYLHRLALQSQSYTGRRREVLTLPHHGMAALADALATAARAVGVIIRTSATVDRVRMEQGRACGVVLDGGEEIAAKAVVSSADPRRTFLDLVGPRELDAGFVRRIHNLRSRGAVAHLDLALDGPPEFAGVDASRLGARFVIAPGVDYAERAFNPSKYGEWSDQPVFELVVPSVHDRSLAPGGGHVLSVLVQYAPHELTGGWSERREAFVDHVLAQLEPYLPGLGRRVVQRHLMTPVDIEREYRITGGHWHHVELALDQALMLRPVPGAGRYDTPVPGLYLCGAGSHPGGGVSGLPGRNAARRILAESTP
jgi:phytoene dehydrogenase-like protein